MGGPQSLLQLWVTDATVIVLSHTRDTDCSLIPLWKKKPAWFYCMCTCRVLQILKTALVGNIKLINEIKGHSDILNESTLLSTL